MLHSLCDRWQCLSQTGTRSWCHLAFADGNSGSFKIGELMLRHLAFAVEGINFPVVGKFAFYRLSFAAGGFGFPL